MPNFHTYKPLQSQPNQTQIKKAVVVKNAQQLDALKDDITGLGKCSYASATSIWALDGIMKGFNGNV